MFAAPGAVGLSQSVTDELLPPIWTCFLSLLTQAVAAAASYGHRHWLTTGDWEITWMGAEWKIGGMFGTSLLTCLLLLGWSNNNSNNKNHKLFCFILDIKDRKVNISICSGPQLNQNTFTVSCWGGCKQFFFTPLTQGGRSSVKVSARERVFFMTQLWKMYCSLGGK